MNCKQRIFIFMATLTLLIGLQYIVLCNIGSSREILVYASSNLAKTNILSKVNAIKTESFDYWKDFNVNTPDIAYTKNSINIRTSEYMLNTIKSLADCKILATKVIIGFNKQNRFVYPRSEFNVQLEIYFHIQSEKWARIHKDLETHKHTMIINMGTTEGLTWNLFNTEEKINNLAAGENISTKYTVFINNYRNKVAIKKL